MPSRRTFYASLSAAAFMAVCAPALAATAEFTADGTALAIADPCARKIAVSVDPSLSNSIAVAAEADHPEEIAQLSVSDLKGKARVGARTHDVECWRPAGSQGFRPTLQLTIRMPERFPVSIEDGGLAEYRIDRTGPLTVSISGMIGMTVGKVAGDVRMESSGASKIDLGEVEAKRLTASFSGAGGLKIDDGQIDTLTVEDSGATTVRITPVVGNATLETSGIGSITVGGVRGSLQREASGLGRITVSGRP